MTAFNRRQFLRCGGACLAAAGMGLVGPLGGAPSLGGDDDIRGHIFKGDAPAAPWKWSKEAAIYRKLADGQVMCGVCPHQCVLAPGDRSVCRSRVNIDGTLYSLAYGNPCAVHVDPVEKKPLYHFMPGTTAFSIAAAGCNFRCLNCQNWEISQAKPHEVQHVELFPKDVVAAAKKAGATAIAYTYSEPVTFYEYTLDTAEAARATGIYNLLISAGYIRTEPLQRLCRVLDGANVNLKSFSDAIYRKLNGGRLQPVLDTFVTLKAEGVHFEMTNLVVPGYVDDPGMVRQMCRWIMAVLGPDHPLHFTRFYPRYRLDRLAATPIAVLEQFRDIAMAEGIRYVYVGNVPGHAGNHTYCHNCGRCIILRRGYLIAEVHLKDGACAFCATRIPGVWPAGGAL
ncbi:MAG: AmmeMemoRadiSam system radical SAM enzyme [Pseudomonadota bacterium]